MKIEIFQYGEYLCSTDYGVIREIMRADTSLGQEEELRRVMRILAGFSRNKPPDNMLEIDLGEVLGDGVLTADKTVALPILLAAVRRQGAAERLLPRILRTMTVYTNVHTAVLEIHCRSLMSLKRLCEAVCSGTEEGSGFSADEAAERIIKALPEEDFAFCNMSDLRLLRSAVRGIKAVADECTDREKSEKLEEFILSAEPLMERLEDMEREYSENPYD